jgi:hypothetical protein
MSSRRRPPSEPCGAVLGAMGRVAQGLKVP